MSDLSDFVTAVELANMLKKTPAQIWRWTRAGVLPVIKLNARSQLYSIESVEKALRKLETKGR